MPGKADTGKQRPLVICTRCGAIIPGVTAHRKICDECRKIAKREYQKRRQRTSCKAIAAGLQRKSSAQLSISEVVKLAAEAGMTYGEYVSRYCRKEN